MTKLPSITQHLNSIVDAKAREEFEDPIVSQASAAVLLGVSVSTLTRWRSSGSGPTAMKFGGKVKYRLSSLKAYMGQALISGGK